MPNLDKLHKKARKHLQRQMPEAAIETYQEILRHDPGNEEALANLGDLSSKSGRTSEAAYYQTQLGDLYVKRGEAANAVAAFRKALALAPYDGLTWLKLAGLLESSRLQPEALEAYRQALGLYRKVGFTSQMLDCLARIGQLDPENLAERVEFADLTSRARQIKVAVPALLHAAQLARRARDEALWEKLVDQAHALEPTDQAAAIAAAELSLRRGNFTEALKLAEPLLGERPEDVQLLEFTCRGFLGLGDYTRAHPLCLKLFQANPKRADLVVDLLEGQLRKGGAQLVFASLRELKEGLFRQGKRNEVLRLMEKIVETDEANPKTLEFLISLYNEMNKDDELRRSLARLFDLCAASEDYDKAAETLERILDVDPYGEGHAERLAKLHGCIDAILYKNILARLRPPSAGRASPATDLGTSTVEPPESFEDLLVEAEMYHQYQLSTKLMQALRRIDQLFPGEEEKSQRLSELYDAAGYTPRLKPPTAAPVAARPDGGAPAVGPSPPVDDLRKISEITASIYRESTAQRVLQVAVNELGLALHASRCWAAVGSVDRPPALATEYCAPSVPPSEPAAAMRLFTHLMDLAASSPDGWSVEDAPHAALLSAVNAEIQKLAIRAFYALPLIDKDAPIGLLLVEECEASRVWTSGEVLLLKTTATQVVIALSNTKLRRLVRSLADADAETGLLPRSAYLDCLLSEAKRCKDQSQPLSVCLLEPENPHALMKSLGDAGVQRFVLQVSKALTPALRQSDISIRYSPLSIAVLFPDTALPQAGLAVEKARRTLAQPQADAARSAGFCAAVCEVPLGPNFDAVDAVTEVINRLEASLERAHKDAGKRILISRFTA
jgi:GAF domain-containing protein